VNLKHFENGENNDFFLAAQFWISGDYGKKRADLIGFVNGLPLVFIELKASHRALENACKYNLSDYRSTIPHVFWHNALIILSNGTKSRIGSMTAGWEHFAEWKKINDEGEEGIVSLDTMIRGVCEPSRLLDLVENFTIYSEAKGGIAKLISKNHQFLGVNRAIQAAREIKDNQGGLLAHAGVWQELFNALFLAEDTAEASRQLDVPDRHGSGRPRWANLPKLRLNRSGAGGRNDCPCPECRAPEAAARLRGSPIPLHADPEIPY
jgi:hypothetical protein